MCVGGCTCITIVKIIILLQLNIMGGGAHFIDISSAIKRDHLPTSLFVALELLPLYSPIFSHWRSPTAQASKISLALMSAIVLRDLSSRREGLLIVQCGGVVISRSMYN